jgi:hypothetical protein
MTNVQGDQTPAKLQKMLKKILELIIKDCHQTIHELADIAGINYEVCQEILSENLNMRRIAMKFVIQLLTNEQSSGA